MSGLALGNVLAWCAGFRGLVEFDFKPVLDRVERGAGIAFQLGRLTIKVMHVEHRRAIGLGAVADGGYFLQIIPRFVLGKKAPGLGRKRFLINDQGIALELKTFGQTGDIQHLLVDISD